MKHGEKNWQCGIYGCCIGNVKEYDEGRGHRSQFEKPANLVALDQQNCELLKCKNGQLDSVQARTEIRSYADHVAKNWPQQSAEVVTPAQVKQELKAVQEEYRSLMMFRVKVMLL